MGTTIYFEGGLASIEQYEKLIHTVMVFAEEHNLPFLLFGVNPDPLGTVPFQPKESWLCPIQGIFLQPDVHSDPLVLEFDADLKMKNRCSTQFANITVHLLVIELLRRIQPLFENFSVVDESEYWEKGDLQLLQKKRAAVYCGHAQIQAGNRLN
jgi:hypothetical protein